MRPVRVLIVEPDDIISAGVCAILDRDSRIHVLGATTTSRRAIDLIREVGPDVVVANGRLSDGSGVEFCEWLRDHCPSLPVLMLSLEINDSVLLRSLEAGAQGFVHVGICAEDLRQAVIRVATGESVLDPKVAGRVIGLFRHRSLDRSRSLSRRETEVMRAVSGGSSDRHIAAALGVSHNTVKTYLRRSLYKLGCRTRSEAAAKFGALTPANGPPGLEQD